MRRLEATFTYTDDEINRLARGGKHRGHVSGVGRVLPARATASPSTPAHESTLNSLHKKVDFMMRLFKSDSKYSYMFSQFESGGASGSGGCGDDEERADHQDDKDEDGDGQPPVSAPPPQGYPPQEGYAKDAYPPQGYPPSGYPPQQQAYPAQGYPQQQYPPQYAPQYAQPPPQQQKQNSSTGCLEGCKRFKNTQSSGMILALGARGPEFDSRNAPVIFIFRLFQSQLLVYLATFIHGFVKVADTMVTKKSEATKATVLYA
nr:cysteine-rich and transmembrane domain-containing protein WIH2-like [Tanacetum cinerariifolium]